MNVLPHHLNKSESGVSHKMSAKFRQIICEQESKCADPFLSSTFFTKGRTNLPFDPRGPILFDLSQTCVYVSFSDHGLQITDAHSKHLVLMNSKSFL